MADLLSAEEITSRLAELDGWSGDKSGISRSASLPTFPYAINVVDQVALAAEEMDHHPDIDIRWRTVTFRCATHSAGGVTERDFTLAEKIDQIIAAASD